MVTNEITTTKPSALTKEDVMRDLDNKITATVTEICTKFKYEVMRCVNCPILQECKYPQKRLEKLKNEAKKMAGDVYQEEIELDDSAENTLRAQNKRDSIYHNYISDNAYSVLKNDRCIFEREEIIKVLQKFVDAGYDITDPRAYLVINELLGNILNSGRANKAFTSLGIILKKETPAGPIYYENPLLKTKMAFSKLIIEATEALDRMLKSDDSQKAQKDFTAHLLQALQIREKKQHKVIDMKSVKEIEATVHDV